jgi:hypothetical protein
MICSPPDRARTAPQARRSWHRRQGRQDRRPRYQGPEGPRHDPRRVRGWPAAPAACGCRSSRASTTRSASSTRRSTSTRSRSRPRRGHPRVAVAKGLVGRARWSRCSAVASSTAPVTVKAHAFSKSAEAAITAAGGTVEVLPSPSASVRLPRATTHQPLGSPEARQPPGRPNPPAVAEPLVESRRAVS